MAIADVRVRRSLKLSESADDKDNTRITASLELLIISDTKDPSFADILANTATWTNVGGGSIPQLGDVTTVNGVQLRVTQRDLEFEGDSDRVVVMTIRYSSREQSQSEPPNGTDPESWIRMTFQTQQMTQPAAGFLTLAAAEANQGWDFARNSAGDPVDGLEKDVAMVRGTYTNTAVLNPNFTKLNEYTNTCNANPFLGAAVYQVRCMGWSAEYDQKNGVWSVSLEFLYNPDSWEIQFYDVGFNEIIDQKRVAILDRAGNPVSKPVPLDGAGRAAAIGVGGGSVSEFQPVPLTTRYIYPYRAVNMATIFNDCGV